MTDDEIIKLWRQHYEVMGFAHALMEKLKEPKRQPVAWMGRNAVGFKFFRIHRPDDIYKPVPLYDLSSNK